MTAIRIVTEKDDFTGGDVVEGRIVLQLDEALPVRGVRVRFIGRERARWDASPGRDLVHQSDEHALFEAEQTLLGRPAMAMGAVIQDALKGLFSKDHYEVIEAGRHELPFAFKLPPSLPGDYESPRGSSIRYEVVGRVDLPLQIDLHATKRLTIHEEGSRHRGTSKTATEKKEFRFEPSAPLQLTARLDRTRFEPGDQALCQLTICNRSSRTIDAVQVAIRQIEDLMVVGLPHENRFDIPVAGVQAPEIPQGQATELEVPFDVPQRLYASITQGKLVNVRYQLAINLDIPWARDLEAVLPIVIHERPGKPSGGGSRS